MINHHWQIQEAKNKFSDLVKNAQQQGPQIITKHGKDAVVLISIDTYKKLTTPKTDLISFFQNSPLAGAGIEISRSKDTPRDVEL